jgi:hypothetical protein
MNPYNQYVESNRFRDDEYGIVPVVAMVAKKAVSEAKRRGIVGGPQQQQPQQIIVQPAPAPSSTGIMVMVLGSVAALGVGLAIGSRLAR